MKTLFSHQYCPNYFTRLSFSDSTIANYFYNRQKRFFPKGERKPAVFQEWGKRTACIRFWHTLFFPRPPAKQPFPAIGTSVTSQRMIHCIPTDHPLHFNKSSIAMQRTVRRSSQEDGMPNGQKGTLKRNCRKKVFVLRGEREFLLSDQGQGIIRQTVFRGGKEQDSRCGRCKSLTAKHLKSPLIFLVFPILFPLCSEC